MGYSIIIIIIFWLDGLLYSFLFIFLFIRTSFESEKNQIIQLKF